MQDQSDASKTKFHLYLNIRGATCWVEINELSVERLHETAKQLMNATKAKVWKTDSVSLTFRIQGVPIWLYRDDQLTELYRTNALSQTVFFVSVKQDGFDVLMNSFGNFCTSALSKLTSPAVWSSVTKNVPQLFWLVCLFLLYHFVGELVAVSFSVCWSLQTLVYELDKRSSKKRSVEASKQPSLQQETPTTVPETM